MSAAIQIETVPTSQLKQNGWQGPSYGAFSVPMADIEAAGYGATAYSREDNLVSMSWNSLNGVFCDRLICYKEKLIIKFDVINGENLKKLLYGPFGIYSLIMKVKHRYFKITVDPDKISCAITNENLPEEEYVTDHSQIYYFGTPTKIERLGGSTKPYYVDDVKKIAENELFSVELHFILANGHKINPFLEPTPEPSPETSEVSE